MQYYFKIAVLIPYTLKRETKTYVEFSKYYIIIAYIIVTRCM